MDGLSQQSHERHIIDTRKWKNICRKNFREILDGCEYLYWYSFQAEGGIGVTDSESYIDKKHLEYWEECIDPSYGMVDLDPQVLMIPKPIYETMEELDRQYDDTFKKELQ